ncbi:MAG: 2-oxoglutarate dehydrogenase E2 component (dihydrolipoamide succinyltransferase), partial [Lentimonas sp.]
MATEVKIPSMGESISSGILAVWHVKDGDYVEKDQAIYELETDKITSEANAEVSGIIHISVAADEEVEIGQVVATIDETASAPAGGAAPTAAAPAAATAAAPAAAPVAAAPVAAAQPAATPVAASSAHTLSPAARKAAEETGVNTAAIAGSGKDGRVTKGDILEAAKAPAAQPVAAATPAAAPSSPAVTVDPASRETRKKMSPLRRKIAERLVTATQEAAMLTTFNEVDMSAVMQLRKKHQEKFVAQYGIKLGFMSFFTKAVTHALQAVPA